MEKVYDLTTESEYFRSLCVSYIQMHSQNCGAIFAYNHEPLDCHELLRFAVHQAQCGENVYLLGFPRQIQVLHRPETLFFFEHWADFLDISELDHSLILSIYNRNEYSNHKISEVFTHIQKNFKSVVSIGFQN